MPQPPDWMRVGEYAPGDTRNAGAVRGGLASAPGTVVVQGGDSVSVIAQRHGVATRDVIALNGLKPPYTVYPGQTLRMPAPARYTVRRGDTLSGIANGLGVETATLAARNRLSPPYALLPGQQLVIPSAGITPSPGRTPPAAAPAPAPPASGRTMTATAPGPTAVPATRSVPKPPVAAPLPRASRQFAWPMTGRILSSFGPKEGGLHNDGINIAAQSGDPVRAAENGVVVYAGNELAGFGNLLLLRHADGWVTAYAHNADLLVKRGDQVNRGQIIARAGRTGNVNAPQLHFEIRQGRQAVNPLQHLPQMTSMLVDRD